MKKDQCDFCQRPKATLECGICKGALCKSCAQFIDEEDLSFFAEIPEDLGHSAYCMTCYDQKAAPQLVRYNHTMALAKEVLVFSDTQTKETRYIKRIEKPIQVEDCVDREETVLRLAFFAAQAGFNAIVDMNVSYKKVRMGAYQTTSWSGKAIPAQVNPQKLVKDKSIWDNPN